jgi:F-type H+-transporting ATPase subunit a
MRSPEAIADTIHSGTKALADTVHAAAAEGGGHGGAFNFSNLLHHSRDSRIIEIPFGHIEFRPIPPFQIGGVTIDLSVTKHVFFLLFSAVLISILTIWSARSIRKKTVPHGFPNFVETLVVFIRDEVVLPNMGRDGLRYLPYLLTTFFFILTMNLIGLVPFGATATGNVMVTAGLAVIAFFMIQVSAIKAQGFSHYLAHLTGGVHWTLWPIMIPIEILGLFTKPFALCIRLFANMTGGHIVILSLIGLIFIFRTIWMAPVSVLFSLGIYLLELFVSFLQAYVFTMLTSLFMGLGMQAAEGHAEEGH